MVNTGLSSLPKQLFDKNQILSGFWIDHADIESLDPALFDNNPHLSSVWVGNTGLESLPSSLFDNNPELGLLYFPDNELKAIPSGLLAGKKELWEVDFSYNSIKNVSQDAFAGCKHLHEIDLRHNNISTIGAGVFDTPNLKIVSLGGNKVDRPSQSRNPSHHAPPYHPTASPPPRLQISTVDPDAFGPEVEYVWIPDNEVTCADLTQSGAMGDTDTCIGDAYCPVGLEDHGILGNGHCDKEIDPRYDTEECAWDAGDC